MQAWRPHGLRLQCMRFRQRAPAASALRRLLPPHEVPTLGVIDGGRRQGKQPCRSGPPRSRAGRVPLPRNPESRLPARAGKRSGRASPETRSSARSRIRPPCGCAVCHPSCRLRLKLIRDGLSNQVSACADLPFPTPVFMLKSKPGDAICRNCCRMRKTRR